MIAFPIPTDETVAPIVVIIFAIAASLGFIVLVVQAVRYLRNNRDEENK